MTGLLITHATVTMAGVDYVPISGDLTLDETTTYASATWELPYDEAHWALDPNVHTPPRVTVNLIGGKAGEHPGTVHADLTVRSIGANAEADTMTFTASSDEAIMSEYSLMTMSTDNLLHGGSVRAIVNNVLERVFGAGVALEPTPADDAPIVSLSGDNMISNSSVEFDATGWTVWSGTGGAATGARSNAGGAYHGTWHYRTTWTTAPTVPTAGPNYRFTRLQTGVSAYAGSAWVRTSLAQPMRFGVEWFDKDSNPLGTTTYGPAQSCAPGVWTRIYVPLAIAPAGGVLATVTIYGDPGGTNWPAGSYVDVDAAEFGPLVSNPLVWNAGTSAWEYQLSLTSSVGLRLFCDETRKWRLVPASYALAPTIPLTRAELSRVEQSADRSDGSWADGVVITYTWPGLDGAVLEWHDAAGTEGKVQLLEFELPYPGPGAAAMRLYRLQSQRRGVGVTAEVNYLARPGASVQVTLPDEPTGRRRIQSVTFPFQEALMTITTRELLA